MSEQQEPYMTCHSRENGNTPALPVVATHDTMQMAAELAQIPTSALDNLYRQLAGGLHAIARARGLEIKIVVIKRGTD